MEEVRNTILSPSLYEKSSLAYQHLDEGKIGEGENIFKELREPLQIFCLKQAKASYRKANNLHKDDEEYNEKLIKLLEKALRLAYISFSFMHDFDLGDPRYFLETLAEKKGEENFFGKSEFINFIISSPKEIVEILKIIAQIYKKLEMFRKSYNIYLLISHHLKNRLEKEDEPELEAEYSLNF